MNKLSKIAKDRIRGSELMIKKIAWNTFKNTGDVNAFLEFKQIQNRKTRKLLKSQKNHLILLMLLVI